MTMRILVVNAIQTETVGDAALLSVLGDQLEQAFPGCEIGISSLDDPRHHVVSGRWRNLGSLRRWSAAEDISRPRRTLRKAFVAALGFLWFRGPRGPYERVARFFPAEVRAELRALVQADLVVSCSGGYLNGTKSISGDLSVACTVAPLILAERLGTPVICGPQSVGPFGREFQRRSAQRALRGAELVLVREDTSFALVRAMGVEPPTLARAVDSAFGFRAGPSDGWRDRISAAADDVLVGMTARAWLAPPHRDAFERTLARLIDHIQSDPRFRVVLVPQNTSTLVDEDDREVNRRVAAHCEGPRLPLLVERRSDPTEITGLYSSLDFVVGMRFHSVIFALTSFVPSIAIGYHHKAMGIMSDLGLEEWVVPLEAVTADRITALFDRLVQHREEYAERLRKVIPEYVERSDGVTELIRTAFELALVRPEGATGPSRA